MANTIHLSPLKLLQQKGLFQKSHSLKIAMLQSGIHRDEKEGTSIDDEFTKQKLITYMWLCLIFIVNSRCSTRAVNIQFNCNCATKEMLETTKEKMMHISSSSSSVREFDASKLVVYWKSMSFERLICFATLSHQFTM